MKNTKIKFRSLANELYPQLRKLLVDLTGSCDYPEIPENEKWRYFSLGLQRFDIFDMVCDICLHAPAGTYFGVDSPTSTVLGFYPVRQLSRGGLSAEAVLT